MSSLSGIRKKRAINNHWPWIPIKAVHAHGRDYWEYMAFLPYIIMYIIKTSLNAAGCCINGYPYWRKRLYAYYRGTGWDHWYLKVTHRQFMKRSGISTITSYHWCWYHKCKANHRRQAGCTRRWQKSISTARNGLPVKFRCYALFLFELGLCSILSKPSIDRSSSINGQWIP